jgi:hypothetical protein
VTEVWIISVCDVEDDVHYLFGPYETADAAEAAETAYNRNPPIGLQASVVRIDDQLRPGWNPEASLSPEAPLESWSN